MLTPIVCLALTVYFEARAEPIAGQVAVAQVVLNRVESPLYPGTVCDVVFQGGEAHTNCQFSFYCDGKTDTPFEADAWVQAWIVADAVLAGSGHVEMKGVLNYHANYVTPYWAPGLRLAAVVGRHRFYRNHE